MLTLKIHPIEEENHLPNLHDFEVEMLIFQVVSICALETPHKWIADSSLLTVTCFLFFQFYVESDVSLMSVESVRFVECLWMGVRQSIRQ